MAEYERMVSYFYRYQNGMKLDNVGFGKFELRQGRLKVTINMNDNRMMGTSVYRVYLYQYESGQMRLTELDGVEEQKGGLHFHFEKEATDILKQKSLSEYSGVLVYQSEQLFYGSQWNDDPIQVRGLETNSKKDMDETTYMRREDPIAATEPIRQTSGAGSSKSKSFDSEPPVSKQSISKTPKETATQHMDDTNQSQANKPDWDSMSKQLDQMAKDINQTIKTEEPLTQTREPLTGIPYLLKHRPLLPAFANHEVMQCVRIQPEDIGLLHRDNWEYGNNSFVMHGFYQYRYLLLGCMQYQDGTKQYVIGVPGIYSNKDKYLANIFKFHEFIPMKNCPFRTGEFGYWIGKLKN